MKKSVLALAMVALFGVGCARIESGSVGLREKLDKTIDLTELKEGSFNQLIIGGVLHFPIRDIRVDINDMRPQTSDNSTLADFDITVVYAINPAQVGELYTTKSRGMHSYEKDAIYLMYSYIQTVARNAAYKSARKHEAMKIADARVQLEADTMATMIEMLKMEKLDLSINVKQIQVRNVQPASEIINSANIAIKAQNELKAKQVEVDIARKEAERLQLLANDGRSIRYLEVKALQDIAEGVKNGKVQTIVVPYDFKGIINTGK